MAQLPPKAPQNWPHHFPHQKMPINMEAPNGNPLWVDHYLDFSSSSQQRGSHRRSISDSIAFLGAPMVEECRIRSNIDGGDRHHQFERFDDEQLMSMFADDATVEPTSNPSPSDHNRMNDNDEKMGLSDRDQGVQTQPKSEPEEVESSCKSEGQNGQQVNQDPRRVKRILANRQSAQRSRVRKLHYISELERSVSSLQAEVSVLSPRVAFLDHQRLVLNVDNSVLKQRIAALAQDKLFKDAHQEALKKEIERLRQIQCQQNLKKKKMENTTGPHTNSPQRAVADSNYSAEKEQLMAVN